MPTGNPGIPKSPEHRAKIGAAQKGRPKSPEHHARIAAHWKAWAKTPEGREAAKRSSRAGREGRIRWLRSPKGRESQRRGVKAMAERMRSPKGRESLKRLWKYARSVGRPGNPSGPEKAMALLLDRLGVEYQMHHKIGKYRVDFYVPSRNLVIEVDHPYWHGLPEIAKRDAQRDDVLSRIGYAIRRVNANNVLKRARKGGERG